ncbi:hypothetical protein F4820DRAFT_402086, partial [Hypoxylon rubiginosum]
MAFPPRPILKRRSSWDRTTPAKIRCTEQSSSASATAATAAAVAVITFSDVAINMETGERVLPSSRSRAEFIQAAEERRSSHMLELFRAREEAIRAEIEAASRRGFGNYSSDEEFFINGDDDGEVSYSDGSDDDDDEGEEGEEEEVEVEWFGNVKFDGERGGEAAAAVGGGDDDEFEIVFEAEETSDEEGHDGSDEWDEDEDDEDEDMDTEGGCKL